MTTTIIIIFLVSFGSSFDSSTGSITSGGSISGGSTKFSGGHTVVFRLTTPIAFTPPVVDK